MSSFAGRTVLVTGGGRGIGRGIAEAFARQGAQVMLGVRTPNFGEEAREAIRASGGVAELFQLDVKDPTACRNLVATTVATYGRLDVVVHCAADIPHGGLGEVTDQAMEAGIASSAKAAWWLLDAARPHLSRSGAGRFIAIGSINGTRTAVRGLTAYGMAKAALSAFVRGAALDVAHDGITVNEVLPGLIASARAHEVLGEAGLATLGAQLPIPRAGTPADVAHACLFLASEASGYVTGASIVVDGGSTLSNRPPGGLLDLKIKHRVQGANT